MFSVLFVSLALVGVYVQLGGFFIETTNVNLQHVRQSDGAFVEYYQNGKISSEEFYKDGFRYGNWRFYYADGSLKKELNYQKGLLDGIQMYFSKNSKLIYTEEFIKGELKELDIKNDSLYKYEVSLFTNGQEIFEKECQSCHLSKKGNVTVPYYLDKFSEETVNFDSVFVKYFNSIHGDSVRIDKVDSIISYDVLAVIRYIDIQYQTARRKPNEAIRLRKFKLNKKSPQL